MSVATTYQMGEGTILSLSTDGGDNFTPVKQLKTVSFAGYTTEFEDITNMDSPNGVREFAPTLSDPGTAECQGVFFDADPGQLAFNAAVISKVACKFKLQFPPRAGQNTGFLRTWNGFVSKGGTLDAQFDKSATFSGSIKNSGPFADTPGA